MTRAMLGVVLLSLLACKKDDAADTTTPTFNIDDTINSPPPDDPSAFVRVVNLVPSEPDGARFSVDGSSSPAPELEPFTGTVWREVDPGTRTFRAGPADGEESDEWASVELMLEENDRYSMVIFGAGDDIRLIAFQEDNTTLSKNEVRYLLFHAGAGQAPIDIYFMEDDAVGDAFTTGLTYGEAPTEVERDREDLEIGIDLDGDKVPEGVFEIPELNPRVSVPIHFLVDDTDLVMVGQAPMGAVRVDRVSLDPGEVNDTDMP